MHNGQGKKKKRKREAELNAMRWGFMAERKKAADNATEAVRKFTGHNTVSNWRRSKEYQRIQELAIQQNGQECSCCNKVALKVFITRFRGEDITGANLDHWRPLCEYHFHYIMSKSNTMVAHNEIFYALCQTKRQSLVTA